MFHPLRIARIVPETADAKSIVLDIPVSLAHAFTYRAGQFVTVEVDVAGERLRRSYSLASSPDHDDEHKIAVKCVRDGRVSRWLNEHLREGDVLSVHTPEGRFVLDGRDAPLLLFAAGSGITPVISLVKSALKTTTRKVTLLYANRDARSIIFEDELRALERAHPQRLRVVHRLDDVHGLIGEEAVRRLVADAPGASAYLCGPGPFMTMVEAFLAGAGVAGEHVHIERFEAVARPPAAPTTSGDASGVDETPDFVEVTLRGKTQRVAYKAGKTLLQTARDAGLDAPYSCEEGFCGCCASDLLEGRVVMAADDALSNEEKKKGMILACQSRPVTKRCAFRFVDS